MLSRLAQIAALSFLCFDTDAEDMTPPAPRANPFHETAPALDELGQEPAEVQDDNAAA